MRHATIALVLTALLAGCSSPTDSTIPDLVSASPALAATLRDDPGIDRSRFQPELLPGLDWTCHFTSDRHGIVCSANAEKFENRPTFEPEFQCADGSNVNSRGSQSLFAIRHYNGKYELVRKILHWYDGEGQYRRVPEGSGKTASGHGLDRIETFTYAIPGNVGEGVTEIVRGVDAEIDLDAPGRPVLALNRGKLRFDPDGNFTVLFGRWDFLMDPEGVTRRVCTALR